MRAACDYSFVFCASRGSKPRRAMALLRILLDDLIRNRRILVMGKVHEECL
jgi:hypothetical protein